MKTSLLLIFLLLTACGKPPPKTLAKLPDDAVILAFGDSLTYGTGASASSDDYPDALAGLTYSGTGSPTSHDYPAVLANLAARKVINKGVPGETSGEGRLRLPALLDDYQPKLLILIHGGNDMLKKMPRGQTVENLKQMIAEAKSRQIEVMLLGVPEPNLWLLSSADFYQTVAESEDVLVDLDTLPDILSDKDLRSDLIHPNDEGYRLMAEGIFKRLKAAGAL